MSLPVDPLLLPVYGAALGLLAVATLAGRVMRRVAVSPGARALADNWNTRTNAWWVMAGVFGVAVFVGPVASVTLFALMSLLALREFVTLSPTRSADYPTLFWMFFVCLPAHYVLLGVQWYGLFSIFIPVYAFLFVPIRTAVAGDVDRFLERTAKLHWGLVVCVYCISHAPALLMLDIPGYQGNAKLLLYMVFVVQVSDVFQYVFGKFLGRRPVAPHVSPNKTWEGLIGGVATATLAGGLLFPITPFSFAESLGLALVITLMGFFGGLVMSAIKRDRGVKDYGEFIGGHGGMLDRIDSLCFAAPVFFHLVRYFHVP